MSVQDLRHRLGTERIARNCRSMSPPPSTDGQSGCNCGDLHSRPACRAARNSRKPPASDGHQLSGFLSWTTARVSRHRRAVVEGLGLPRWEYLVEPRPGLARARNRALSAVRTDLVAWIDDDEVADPDWVRRLKEGFAHEAKPAAVCGVMLPAELEFEAQVRFEQYGGFNKGRGMAA